MHCDMVSIIVPHGGSEKDLKETFNSICRLSEVNPSVKIEVIVVFNNLSAPVDLVKSNKNLYIKPIDINPVSCRSTARNTGISEIDMASRYVLFLDSGDYVLARRLNFLDELQAAQIIVHNAIVYQSDKKRLFRKTPYPISWQKIVNPFYLGAVWVKVSIAKSISFQVGRKEDWKFWLSSLELGASVHYEPEDNYVYVIKNVTDHTRRKYKLIFDQYNFFRSYLGLGKTRSALHLLLHYGVLLVVWFSGNSRFYCPVSLSEQNELKSQLRRITLKEKQK